MPLTAVAGRRSAPVAPAFVRLTCAAVVAVLVTACQAGATAPPAPTVGSAPLDPRTDEAGGKGPSPSPGATGVPSPPFPSVAPPVVLLAAGDIARCGQEGDEATAALLDELAGTIIALGDLAYPDGTLEDLERCFGPSWGRHKDRILPVPGNQEYDEGPDGYLEYFGEKAAPQGETWYSLELGAWHLVVLDSSCDEVGGCGPGSPQLRWLRADLAAHDDVRCTLVAMHVPRWSSGEVGDEPELDPIWRALSAAGADVVLSAHAHHYERFAPLTPGAEVDEARGIRSFVVGTGGGSLSDLVRAAPNSEVRMADTLGVLRMLLWPADYAWEFIPVEGSSFLDGGAGTCH